MTDSKKGYPKKVGIEVETACGGKILLSEDTSHADHNGNRLYFCLEECKALFENDPLNSCLADRIHTHSI